MEIKGYVYVYGADGIYKIGWAKNTKVRLKQLTTLPFRCALRCTFATDFPGALEKILHRKFAEQRLNGEWFRLSEEDILSLETVWPGEAFFFDTIQESPKKSRQIKVKESKKAEETEAERQAISPEEVRDMVKKIARLERMILVKDRLIEERDKIIARQESLIAWLDSQLDFEARGQISELLK